MGYVIGSEFVGVLTTISNGHAGTTRNIEHHPGGVVHAIDEATRTSLCGHDTAPLAIWPKPWNELPFTLPCKTCSTLVSLDRQFER